MTFRTFFLQASGFREDDQPHPWQADLATAEGSSECRDHLIRIPTGFGKTLGVFSAWLC